MKLFIISWKKSVWVGIEMIEGGGRDSGQPKKIGIWNSAFFASFLSFNVTFTAYK